MIYQIIINECFIIYEWIKYIIITNNYHPHLVFCFFVSNLLSPLNLLCIQNGSSFHKLKEKTIVPNLIILTNY